MVKSSCSWRGGTYSIVMKMMTGVIGRGVGRLKHHCTTSFVYGTDQREHQGSRKDSPALPVGVLGCSVEGDGTAAWLRRYRRYIADVRQGLTVRRPNRQGPWHLSAHLSATSPYTVSLDSAVKRYRNPTARQRCRSPCRTCRLWFSIPSKNLGRLIGNSHQCRNTH